MSEHEYEFEPVRGLPQALPPGEQILWQGSPDWKSLALRAYRVRAVALYFAALIAWRIADGASAGRSTADAVLGATWLAVLGVAAAALLLLLAWLAARTTVYTLTNRRLVLRHGIAVPMTVNIPFAVIDSAGLRLDRHGGGDIAVALTRDQRVGYLLTWPHVRPWRFTRPQPALRALHDARFVAQLLSSALRGTPAMDVAPATAPTPTRAAVAA